jgi:flagellar hook protein FlgE
MDVGGNNIANGNTAGFRSAQITFGEAMAQTLQGPAGAGLESGGTNSLQIGLGVEVASIDGVFTQGTTNHGSADRYCHPG